MRVSSSHSSVTPAKFNFNEFQAFGTIASGGCQLNASNIVLDKSTLTTTTLDIYPYFDACLIMHTFSGQTPVKIYFESTSSVDWSFTVNSITTQDNLKTVLIDYTNYPC